MTPDSTHRFAPIDGMRALAIAMVLGAHVNKHLPGGLLGVDIFFAVSGFVITSTLLREQTRSGRISLKNFFARRFLRLQPTLTAFVVCATALALLLGFDHPWADSLSAITYTFNFYALRVAGHETTIGATWSLACEEQFYLVWPAVMVATLRYRPAWLGRVTIIGVVGFIGATGVAYAGGVAQSTLYKLPSTRLPQLLAGVLTAVLVDRGLPIWLRRAVAHQFVPASLLLALAIYLPTGWNYTSRGAILSYLAFPIATCLVILHFVEAPNGPFGRCFSLEPLVYIGRRSYAIYLWHSLPLVLVERYAPRNRFDTVWRSAVVVVVAVILAEVSWRLIETPAARLKERKFGRTQLAVSDDDAVTPA